MDLLVKGNAKENSDIKDVLIKCHNYLNRQGLSSAEPADEMVRIDMSENSTKGTSLTWASR